MAADLAKFSGHPFTRLPAVAMPFFDHERSGCHQHCKFCVAGHVSEVPFENFVLRRKQIAELLIVRCHRAWPICEVPGAN